MSIKELERLKRIYLDTAPIIYQIEGSQEFSQSTQLIFDKIDNGELIAVTSLITLSEVLVIPYRLGRMDLVEDYTQMLTSAENTEYIPILDEEAALIVAKLRAENQALKKFDAQHFALAIQHRCDSFLTNDSQLKKIIGLPKWLKIILLSELEMKLQ
jgi:predicted nucleic acid-binding protein